MAINAPAWSPPDSASEALLRQIAELSKNDPLVGAKIGSCELTQRLLAALTAKREAHPESLLCALGAIAGYSCQASVRAQALARGLPEAALLTARQSDDGKTYYFGDALKQPLAESPCSVWAIAGAGAQRAGCNTPPDLVEIFKHCASTNDTPAFGQARNAQKNTAGDSPFSYVRKYWPALKPLIVMYCPNPEHWPILVGLSIQDVIIRGKSALDPGLALQLVMEAAIPMSEIDLKPRSLKRIARQRRPRLARPRSERDADASA